MIVQTFTLLTGLAVTGITVIGSFVPVSAAGFNTVTGGEELVNITTDPVERPITSTIVTTNSIQVLDFENIASSYPFPSETLIGNFYNGGGGPSNNFGIDFSDNALNICLNSTTVTCSNTSRGGQGDPNSQTGGLFFLSGDETFMTRSAGFTNGFSFFYSAINSGGSFSVYDGVDGTGNILATATLPTTPSGPCPGYNAGFCPFVPFGVSFSGVAQSVSFAGVANQIVFDDVTFGSSTPNPDPDPTVPEPSSLLSLLALGTLSVGLAFKRKLNISRATKK